MILEKPFGRDLASSEELAAALGRLYSESQLWRIDHYLVGGCACWGGAGAPRGRAGAGGWGTPEGRVRVLLMGCELWLQP